MKDPENKTNLSETEAQAVSGGMNNNGRLWPGKEPVPGRIPLYNQGEPVPQTKRNRGNTGPSVFPRDVPCNRHSVIGQARNRYSGSLRSFGFRS